MQRGFSIPCFSLELMSLDQLLQYECLIARHLFAEAVGMANWHHCVTPA